MFALVHPVDGECYCNEIDFKESGVYQLDIVSEKTHEETNIIIVGVLTHTQNHFIIFSGL